MKEKHILLTIALFISVCISAQDKYEFMIIEFNSRAKLPIKVSIDGKEFLEENVDYSPLKETYGNNNPLLKKINEYQNKGWECMSFNTCVAPFVIQFAYLKKKIESK